MNLFLSFISILLLTALVIILPRLRQERILFLIYGSGILLQTIGFEWLFRGLERFKFLAVCQLVAKVISFILMIVFIHSSDQLPLYAGLSVATNYGGDLICFFAARKYIHSFHHIFRGAELNRVVSHLRPFFTFFIMSCAVSIYSSLDLTMLGFMRTDAETGLYSVAAKGKSVLTIIGGVVWSSILPQATRLWKDGKKRKFQPLAEKTLLIVAGIQFLVTMRWMKENGIKCTTADLEEGFDLQLDIQKMNLPDASYDFIFCNHVLEHVEDFQVALAEVRRVVKGKYICSFPMDSRVDLVDEDPMITTEAERIRRFGQKDHRRLFGMNAGKLLEEAGFVPEMIRGREYPEEILPVVGPADYDMNVLLVCH